MASGSPCRALAVRLLQASLGQHRDFDDVICLPSRAMAAYETGRLLSEGQQRGLGLAQHRDSDSIGSQDYAFNYHSLRE